MAGSGGFPEDDELLLAIPPLVATTPDEDDALDWPLDEADEEPEDPPDELDDEAEDVPPVLVSPPQAAASGKEAAIEVRIRVRSEESTIG